jgi:hypothetical protein
MGLKSYKNDKIYVGYVGDRPIKRRTIKDII